ncbi:transmembrane protein 272-like [Epinephelus moara]|uniref:transmembrane protein 272-like n=1 Tax=Epinephelus moara TaxID=300413 RepID=UPI00214F0DD6|nr:transmembrane protein 272-like [Epinephelus moara]
MSESEGLQRIRSPLQPPAAILVCAQVIMGVMPFAQLVVGAVYQHDCPRQPYIPIYLLVMGIVSLLLTVLSILPCCASFGNQSKTWSCLVFLFFLCWFIAGNVWIYSIYEPNYNKTISSLDTYCNKTLYLFAFWTTNLFYILWGFIIFCSCCSCLLCGNE